MTNVVDLLRSLLRNMVENGRKIIEYQLVPRPIPESLIGRVQRGMSAAEPSASSICNPNVVPIICKYHWQVLLRRIQ